MGICYFTQRRVLMTLGLAILLAGFVVAHAQQPKASTQNAPRILVHMKDYIAEIHGTYMGLELADHLQRGGAKVTLWLELRATRLADERVARNLNPKPGSRSFSEVYKSFIEHGGRVLVCHHCAEFEDLSREHLRAGATFVAVADVAQAVIAADKILDY